jgi:serine/threonine protein kinase
LSEHRQVVDVIDAGVAPDGRPYIVMRLYRRGSLAQLLEGSGPMGAAEAVSIVVKVAAALQAAHDHGALHRDVKPENILIADDGEPALGDFGISSIIGASGTTTTAFSMAQVAPEVLSHPDSRLPASDLYSLGSTAYTLLAGHPPFQGNSHLHVMQMIVQSPPPPLGRADVPPGVETVIHRAMAKNPAERYPTVSAFASALEQAMSAPVWAPPMPAPMPAPVWAPPMPAPMPVPAPFPSPAPVTGQTPCADPPRPSWPVRSASVAQSRPCWAGGGLVPLLTMGMLVFIPFLYAALRSRRILIWLSAFAYLLWDIIFFWYFSVADDEAIARSGGTSDALAMIDILVIVVSTVHLLWLRFGPTPRAS